MSIIKLDRLIHFKFMSIDPVMGLITDKNVHVAVCTLSQGILTSHFT